MNIPEEELARLVGTIRDGQQSGVGFADIERDFWDTRSIHREFFQIVSFVMVHEFLLLSVLFVLSVKKDDARFCSSGC